MIYLKSATEIAHMQQAGKLAAGARHLAGTMVQAGVSTIEIDKEINRFICKNGGKPSFLGYNGFPASACISINEEVIHGIPSTRKIEIGDLVKVDVGAVVNGFHGDCANTFICGQTSEENQRLVEVTRASFYQALLVCKVGYRISDIGYAIQSYVEEQGFSVVRDFVGHGIGKNLHEDPQVPNYGKAGRGIRLEAGMTLAIEPMINHDSFKVRILADGWTVVTEDGKPSAHYENTVRITDGEAEVLTLFHS